jgi:transposase
MIVGVVLDNRGRPLCCEMLPGNTADVNSLIPIMDRIRQQFSVVNFCVVADRGIICKDTVTKLESDGRNLPYIFGAKPRKVNEIREIISVHHNINSYEQVYPKSEHSNAPAPLKVMESWIDNHRYILCYNSRQARKDKAARKARIETLREHLHSNPQSVVGNKGYRKYVKLDRDSIALDESSIQQEVIFGGMCVLCSDMDWPAAEVAVKYKELWQAEHAFLDIKSIFETRPIFHKREETIQGHVFCSFLALALRKQLENRPESYGCQFEWVQIKQDLST